MAWKSSIDALFIFLKDCQSGIKWVVARIKQEDALEFFRKFFTAASIWANDRWLIKKRRSEGVGIFISARVNNVKNREKWMIKALNIG